MTLGVNTLGVNTMVVPSWQEIIDDIIEVLSLKHPALKDVSAISTVSIKEASIKSALSLANTEPKDELSGDSGDNLSSNLNSNSSDDVSDDLLDTLVIHQFQCGHFIKVPKYMYQGIASDAMTICPKCL